MLQNPTAMQQRIIRSFVRRNIQGWGKPLAFTKQRVQLGGLFALVTVALFIIFNMVSRTGSAASSRSWVGTFSFFLIGLCFILALGMLWPSLLLYLRATQQPVEQISGTVEATICNAASFLPVARDGYHFITLRQGNGQLRAFAISPELHAQVCQPGRKVTLTVIPGIEHVTRVVEN